MTFAEYLEQYAQHSCADGACPHCRFRAAIVAAVSPSLPAREEAIQEICAMRAGDASPKTREYFDVAVALIGVAFMVQASIAPDEETALRAFGYAVQGAMDRFGFESNVATGPGAGAPGTTKPRLVKH